MVVVETHYYFGIAVVEGDGVDFDEDFVGSWGGQGSGGLSEVFQTILGSSPLLDCGWEGHCGGLIAVRVR